MNDPARIAGSGAGGGQVSEAGASLFAVATTGRIAFNALRVAAVVGSVLNLINQGPVIWDGGRVSWVHLVLNYLVPYCVASYSAAKNEMGRQARRE